MQHHCISQQPNFQSALQHHNYWTYKVRGQSTGTQAPHKSFSAESTRKTLHAHSRLLELTKIESNFQSQAALRSNTSTYKRL